MATVYVINSTDGSSNITLKPGALNGPGGSQRNSDLRLYGMGALQWGEGVDENVYRLMESFSCREKELGDHNPTTGNPDYDPVTDPVLPKDDFDLGPGLGISVPLNGQSWYNDTRKLMYVYDSDISEWKTLSGTFVNNDAPLNPQLGDIWYDTSGTGDPSGCITDPILKIYDPTHPDADPDGFISTSANALRQCGDYMTGILDMGGADGGATATYRIINLGDPIDPLDAVNKQYVDALGTDLANHEADTVLHLTAQQNAYLDSLNLPTLTGAETNFSIGVTSPIQAQLDGKVDITGDTMTGFLTLNAAPTAPLHAATKSFVESAVLTADFMQFDPIGSGQPPQTGDTQTVGNTIQMYLVGTGWVQIWPAQYTP